MPGAAGRHALTLYARQPGAAVAAFEVRQVPPPVVLAVTDCMNGGCLRGGRLNVLTVTVGNLCGPSMVHPGFLLVNGRPCGTLGHSSSSMIYCILAENAFDGVDGPASTATLTFELVPPAQFTYAPEYDHVLRRRYSAQVSVNAIPGKLAAWAGGLICAVILLICIVVGAVIGFRGKKGGRNVGDAPKEGPMVLLFTDIEDSTALWAGHTLSMAASLDTHHRVMRDCIAKHKAYEVKTVGDSFMIACRCPTAGLELARDVQLMLRDEEWPACITAHYLGADLDDDPEVRERVAPTEPFAGPRVRIGVHVGSPDVVFDEVAKGYDYYGRDTNFAARTEAAAKGGQILATQAALEYVAKVDGLVVGDSAAFELKGIGAEPLTELIVSGLPAKRVLGVVGATIDGPSVHDTEDTSASGGGTSAATPSGSVGRGGVVNVAFEETVVRLRRLLGPNGSQLLLMPRRQASGLQRPASDACLRPAPGDSPTNGVRGTASASGLGFGLPVASTGPVGQIASPANGLPVAARATSAAGVSSVQSNNAASPGGPTSRRHSDAFMYDVDGPDAFSVSQIPCVDAAGADPTAVAAELRATVRQRFRSLETLLKPLTAKERDEFLASLARAWRVPRLPKRNKANGAVVTERSILALIERTLPVELRVACAADADDRFVRLGFGGSVGGGSQPPTGRNGVRSVTGGTSPGAPCHDAQVPGRLLADR